MRKATLMAIVAVLVLGLAVPGASAKADHTDFFGVYFPAGLLDGGTGCPYEWGAVPAFCVMDEGDWDFLPSGRLRIRNMEILELAFAWTETGEEPRKTGYDVVVANANLDESFSGPTWGTWNLYRDDDLTDLMFSGTFTGKFELGIPAVHFVGEGTGIYDGQKMRGDIGRVPNAEGWNMFGTIIEKG